MSVRKLCVSEHAARASGCLQDGLTWLLASLLEQQPDWRDVLMLTLAAVGRGGQGGQGDVGQRIRDEILYVQSRNNAKVTSLDNGL